MTNADTHLVDIGDDAKGQLCRCLASGCGWNFSSPDRHERLAAAHGHVTEIMNAR